MDEIDWNARLNPFNHHPAAPHYTTFALDTFPISCLDGDIGDTTFQPKYASNVYKVQVAIGWDGIIYWYRGPHLVSRSDPRLWSLYGPQAWIQKEFGWADGVYSGVHHLIAPFRKPKHAPLAIDWHGWFRARVEHTFATLWSFNLIKHVWPGRGEEGLRRLGNRLKVLMHFINFCEKRKRRYPPYGPWPHFQEVEVDAQPICDVASDSDSSSHED